MGKFGFESVLNHRSEVPHSANPTEASTHPFGTTGVEGVEIGVSSTELAPSICGTGIIARKNEK